MKKLESKTTQTPTNPDQGKSRRKSFFKRRRTETEPGPGRSQEGERNEYHEEPSPKAGTKSYDHQPEKDLEH